MAGRGDLLACAQQLHAVPHWSPEKPEALYREGQSYFEMNRAKDAESAWQNLIKDDPLHPISAELMHDGCQALLKLYAIEDRWEDAFPVIWTAYDHAVAIDRPVLLAMRMRTELERVAPRRQSARWNVSSPPRLTIGRPCVPLPEPSSRWAVMPNPFVTSRHACEDGPMMFGPGATISPCSWTRAIWTASSHF